MCGKKANTTEYIQPSRKKSYAAPGFNVLNSKQAKAELTKKALPDDASVKELFASMSRADNGRKKPARGSAAKVDRGRR